MALDLLKIKHIFVAMRLDREIDQFKYVKVRIVTEQGMAYNLMVRTASLRKFLYSFD